MTKLCDWLIRCLGGVPNDELRNFQIEIRRLKVCEAELSQYKEFAQSIYFYTGSPGYPAWKAQQEFRESQCEIGRPVKGSFSGHIRAGTMGSRYVGRGEYVDNYLGIVVDAFAVLVQKFPHDFGGDISSWSEDHLSSARGAEHLDTLKKNRSSNTSTVQSI